MPTLLGLNSGTSADGVDAVILRFDGELPNLPADILATVHQPYPAGVRHTLDRLLTELEAPLELLCSLHYEIGDSLASAAAAALAHAGLPSHGSVDVCGSHGQTIYHLPPPAARRGSRTPSTWQLGEPSVIAESIRAPVAADFRAADLAAGGEGAPLTPILDHLLFTHPHRNRLRLNIGGIANLTWLPAGASPLEVVAFDTGPGNTLIDNLVRSITRNAETCDRDGRRSARGRAIKEILSEMLSDPYFARKPPKSTGRELFNLHWLEPFRRQAGALNLSDEDLLATVTALTPASIAHAIEHHLPPGTRVDEVIVHGGGARNPVIVNGLRRRLPTETELATVEQYGIPLQSLEPLLFALLGWLCLRRIPVFYSNATGLKHPVILGKLIIPATTPDR